MFLVNGDMKNCLKHFRVFFDSSFFSELVSVQYQYIGDALLQLVHCLYLQLERDVAGEAVIFF